MHILRTCSIRATHHKRCTSYNLAIPVPCIIAGLRFTRYMVSICLQSKLRCAFFPTAAPQAVQTLYMSVSTLPVNSPPVPQNLPPAIAPTASAAAFSFWLRSYFVLYFSLRSPAGYDIIGHTRGLRRGRLIPTVAPRIPAMGDRCRYGKTSPGRDNENIVKIYAQLERSACGRSSVFHTCNRLVQ